MQQLLASVTRYLDCPGVWVLPVGIIGTEALFPIGDDTLHPVRAVTRGEICENTLRPVTPISCGYDSGIGQPY